MIKRPKPTDTEADILQMQNEFLKDQTTNAQFQPAAKLVKIEPGMIIWILMKRFTEFYLFLIKYIFLHDVI